MNHDERANLVPGYLTPKEMAERMRVTTRTLANWRQRGRGPAYFTEGRIVRYYDTPFVNGGNSGSVGCSYCGHFDALRPLEGSMSYANDSTGTVTNIGVDLVGNPRARELPKILAWMGESKWGMRVTLTCDNCQIQSRLILSSDGGVSIA